MTVSKVSLEPQVALLSIDCSACTLTAVTEAQGQNQSGLLLTMQVTTLPLKHLLHLVKRAELLLQACFVLAQRINLVLQVIHLLLCVSLLKLAQLTLQQHGTSARIIILVLHLVQLFLDGLALQQQAECQQDSSWPKC